METSLVVKLAGAIGVLVALVLLLTAVSNPQYPHLGCGTVFSPETYSNTGETLGECEGPLGNRLLVSVTVGAVGVAAIYWSARVGRREEG